MSGQRRVSTIRPAGSFSAGDAIDRVVLDADDRQRRRIVLTGEKGTKLLLDFEKPVILRDGDGLVLEDGSIVVVAGQAEPLLQISAKAPADLVRLACPATTTISSSSRAFASGAITCWRRW